MSARQRLGAAIRRRIRGPYASLGRLDARLHDLQRRLTRTEELLAAARADLAKLQGRNDELLAACDELAGLTASVHELLDGEIRPVLRAVAAEESTNRRRLHQLRADQDYAAPWEEQRPLVTVTVATRDRAGLLAKRSLPSILGQTYEELEVIVVGDHADEATAEAVRALGDSRLIYRNLTQHLHLSDDPSRRWLVAATMARNEAMRLASGRWVACFDDDDAMRPDCVERLLERARHDRLEAVYGRAMVRREGERAFAIGAFPPRLGQFTWASGMYHSGLRFFERQLFASDLGMPGDWFLASQMLRAGVRFGMVDAVLCDIYPSPMNRVQPARVEDIEESA